MATGERPIRLALWLVGTALVAWPRAQRRRDGPGLLAAVEEELAAARGRGPRALVRCAVSEWGSVLGAGLGLRTRLARRWLPGGGATKGRMTMGWTDDARIAARSLLRAPGFAAVVVATLALGIGANGAVWSLVQRVLLRPPPYHRPEELVLVWGTRGNAGDRWALPAPDAAVVTERTAAFTSVAFASRTTDATLKAVGPDAPQHVVMEGVTPDFFRTLGVPVLRGRRFLEEDAAIPSPRAEEGGPPTVLISESAWRRVFDADGGLPGRTVLLNGRPVVVLGIVPAGFRLQLPPAAGIDTDVDVWVPFRVPLEEIARVDGRLVDQDSDNTGAVIARLAAGASVDAARAQLDRIAADLRAEVPGYAAAGFGLDARALHADATAQARPLLVVLAAGAVGVLLVACLGLAALMLARGMSRAGELAVRAALGAGRWRLARALMAESLILLLTGCAGALLVESWVGGILEGLLPSGLADLSGPSGGRGLAPVAAATATVAALFAGMALVQVRGLGRSPTQRSSALRSRFGRSGARRALVVGEIALSVVLLLGAGLLLRTADNLRDVDPGFRAQDALVFDVSVRAAPSYAGPSDRARLAHALERAVLALPGVRAVGLTGALPLSGRTWTQPWGLPGEAESQWAARRADFRSVTSGYFDAIGTRLLEGRGFTTEEDLEERRRVVVVDETVARKIAPDGSAIGAVIGIPLDGRAVEARVVGVAERVRQDDLGRPARGTIYVPYRQEASRDVAFVARTDAAPASLTDEVRRALLAVEPNLAVYGMRPMTDYVEADIAPTRFGLRLLATFSLLAVLAAALGLYGVVAWEVGRRTRELGIRMAVGATAARVRRGVLVDGLALGLAGSLVGTGAATLLAGGMRRLVYGVGMADPLTWAGVAAVVLTVTLVATWIPARRASRLDPCDALRSD